MARLTLAAPKGPAALYAEHPGLHALLLAGAAGAATIMAVRSLRADKSSHKVAWAAAALVEVGIAAGLATLTWGHPKD